MSAAPQLHYPNETDALPRAYNNASAEGRAVEAVMTDTWKRWEGRVVGGTFPLQRYLGGSDHSAVFLTERNGEKAAVKLVPADADTAEAQLSRWRLAAKFSDPRLLHLYEAGRAQLDSTDVLYVVMELTEEDLSQILPQRALTADEAREMLRPVLLGLAYIHKQGCVHGRLRPSNILATGDQVKLSSDSLTASGETTRAEASVYDAPESAGRTLSPSSDVWSLGVTICEALTQRLPDPTGSGQAVLPAGIPEPFSSIARHCLHADPRQRWTIAQVLTRLDPNAASNVAARSSASGDARSATSALAAPVVETRTGERPTASGKPGVRWLYVLPIVVAGLAAWILLSGPKAAKAPTSPPQNEPAAAPASSPEASEAKPSPAKTSRKPTQTASGGAAATSAASEPNTAPSARPIRGSGASVPGVVHIAMPAVSPSARRTITGKLKVRVRVDVDPSGNVTAAVLDSAGPSKYFARLAVDAARDWKFEPAQAHGQFVQSQWLLRFAFTRSDTEIVPEKIAP